MIWNFSALTPAKPVMTPSESVRLILRIYLFPSLPVASLLTDVT